MTPNQMVVRLSFALMLVKASNLFLISKIYPQPLQAEWIAGGWGGLAVTCMLAAYLIQGARWARWLGVVFSIGSVITGIGSLRGGIHHSAMLGFLLLITTLSAALISFLLAFSPKVASYCKF